MATPIIPRDRNAEAGRWHEEEFDWNNPDHHRRFQQFGCDIPEVEGMLKDPNDGRIPDMIDPAIVQGVPPNDPFPTPDRVEPDVFLERIMFHDGIMVVPHGPPVEMWGFEDPDGPEKPVPSELIRFREGQIVHSHLETRHGTHTIHHHGIEPTAFNDGVGHLSFEVSGGGYTYQWQPTLAGTFWYHCHKNTALHVQMGMVGFLIVDPPEGPGRLFTGGPEYDVEAMWAVTEIDTRWHNIVAQNPSAGIECDFFSGSDNPEFNRYEPENFIISGVPADQNNPLITDSRVAITATKGEKILIRILCGGYTTQYYTFDLPITVVGIDGRNLGRQPFEKYSQPFTRQAGETFDLTTARRNTLLIDTADIDIGTYGVLIEYKDWITKETLGVAETTITIT